jgi:hypothetical protein
MQAAKNQAAKNTQPKNPIIDGIIPVEWIAPNPLNPRGCTETNACPGGCYWVNDEKDLCNECAENEGAESEGDDDING